ncbi:hypothetical protein KM043_007978 [Ampulex compressa]|nr:hypothetical protein KM043_007978 [Ampulex compressa]
MTGRTFPATAARAALREHCHPIPGGMFRRVETLEIRKRPAMAKDDLARGSIRERGEYLQVRTSHKREGRRRDADTPAPTALSKAADLVSREAKEASFEAGPRLLCPEFQGLGLQFGESRAKGE